MSHQKQSSGYGKGHQIDTKQTGLSTLVPEYDDLRIWRSQRIGAELFVKGAGNTEKSSESLHPDPQTEKNKQESFHPNDTH